MTALSDAALLARFGWLPDPAAVAEVDDRHRKAAQRAAAWGHQPETAPSGATEAWWRDGRAA